MTGAPPPAAVRIHTLKADLLELRACLDSVISLLADAENVENAPGSSFAAIAERARTLRVRMSHSIVHLSEIYEDLESAPLPSDIVQLAEIRGDLECIAKDRLEPALVAIKSLLARFPEEPR